MKWIKRSEKWFSKHVWYASLIHGLAGVGIGILITNPLVGEHPVRWGAVFLGLGILGHLAPYFDKK